MTTWCAITVSSAGTNEVWVLAIKQAMVLIINLLESTTLAQAARPGEADNAAGVHTQEMTTKPEAQAGTHTVMRQP